MLQNIQYYVATEGILYTDLQSLVSNSFTLYEMSCFINTITQTQTHIHTSAGTYCYFKQTMSEC